MTVQKYVLVILLFFIEFQQRQRCRFRYATVVPREEFTLDLTQVKRVFCLISLDELENLQAQVVEEAD